MVKLVVELIIISTEKPTICLNININYISNLKAIAQQSRMIFFRLFNAMDGADHFFLESSTGVLVYVEEGDSGVFLVGLFYRGFQEICDFSKTCIKSSIHVDLVRLQRE